MTNASIDRRRTLQYLGASVSGATVLGRRARAATPMPIRIGAQFGLAYLPLILMVHDKIWQNHAASRGVAIDVSFAQLGGGAALNDALLSDSAQVLAGGVSPMLTIWDRTRTNYKVKGLSAVVSAPMYLLGNRPGLRSIKDLTEKDRIAVPAVRVSSQAVVLEMGIAKAFGEDAVKRFIPCEVTLSHPDAYTALVGGSTGITAYMSSSPFQERALEHPNITKVADSFDIQGGPATFSVTYAGSRFIDDNPKVIEAYYDAMQEAIAAIAANPSASIDKYVAATGDHTERKLIEKILREPDYRFESVPSRTMQLADFMAKTGLLHEAPKSWEDYFAAPLHTKKGG